MKPISWSTIAFAAILVLVGVGTQAMPKPQYFCQDDFIMTFGEVGQPLAAGTTIAADGRLLMWSDNLLAGWFTMNATVSHAGQSSSGVWSLVFDTGTFKITSRPDGSGTTYWEGSIEQLTLTGYDQFSTHYAAAGYPRPAYAVQPEQFVSVGAASFARSGGTWTDPKLQMDWLGGYNWTYDNSTPETSSHIYGNLQGMLTPEPGSLAALVCGIVGLAGCWRRKRA